jgi:hypothetical protein
MKTNHVKAFITRLPRCLFPITSLPPNSSLFSLFVARFAVCSLWTKNQQIDLLTASVDRRLIICQSKSQKKRVLRANGAEVANEAEGMSKHDSAIPQDRSLVA